MPELGDVSKPCTMRERIKIIERDLVVDALKRHNGSIPEAAAELGLSGRMVRYKINDLAIEYEKIFGRRKGRVRGGGSRNDEAFSDVQDGSSPQAPAPLELGAI